MAERPVTVAELSTFLRTAKAAGLTDELRSDLIDFLARNSELGDVIEGTGGVRKVRWARPGEGKSGGLRTIYYYHDEDAPLYAILVYGKGQQANLTPAQRRSVSALVDELKSAIRSTRERKAKKHERRR